MGFIYRLTFPSKKSYIGQTIRDIHKRLEEHQYASSSCVAVYNAIKKYGWEKVEKEWYEVPDEDLNFYEEMLVALLGTLSPGGYNLMGGGGSKGRPSEESRQKMSEAISGEKHHFYGKEHTEETKQKMSEAQKGKTLSDETKQKLRKANLGKTRSEETKKKISEAKTGEKHPMFGQKHNEKTKQKMSEALSGEKHPMYGKEHTEETKQKISEALSGEKHYMYGKTLSDEHKKKLSEAHTGENNHNSKKVYQYTLDGTYIGSYASGGEAARTLGKTNESFINTCARGKQPSAYGFKWSREPPS